MLQIIIKTGKIGFWVLLPLFLFSNSGAAFELPIETVVKNGNYHLKTTGISDHILSGHVVFRKMVDSLAKGKPIMRLELKLDHNGNTVGHRMGFVISKQPSESGDLVGYYDVNTKLAGLSGQADGLFGFADVPGFGELPFFTDYGKVHITAAENNFLQGKLNVRMRNFEGRNFDLSGSFIASRSK